MDGSTGKLQYKPSKHHVSVVWTIENVESLLNPPKGEKVVEWSPVIDGRWRVQLSRNVVGHGGMALYLFAEETEADRQNRTKDLRWVRAGEGTGTFSLLGSSDAESITRTEQLPRNCNSAAPNWGWPDFATAEQLRALAVTTTIQLHIELLTIDTDYNPPLGIEKHLFDDPTCSNVLFTVSSGTSGPPRRIFAIKSILTERSEYFKTLFASGFKESQSFVSVDSSKTSSRERSVVEDEDDMAPFDIASSTSSQFKYWGDEGDGVIVKNLLSRETGTTDPNLQIRTYLEVKVETTPFIAYRSMIFWLYTRAITFLPLASDWLIAYKKAQTTHEGSLDTFTFRPRPDWLRDELAKSNRLPSPEGTIPCSSHTVYRLAHRYYLVKLCNIAKSHIVSNLNVENVSYELFSPLSLHFSDIQNAVFEFFEQNWTVVKKTSSFRDVLARIHNGDLPDAVALTEKIFDKLEMK